MTQRSVWGLALFTALAGCAAPIDVLRPRAAFDLQCGPEKLELTELYPGQAVPFGRRGAVYGVRGCGRQASYSNPVGDIWELATPTSQ